MVNLFYIGGMGQVSNADKVQNFKSWFYKYATNTRPE